MLRGSLSRGFLDGFFLVGGFVSKDISWLSSLLFVDFGLVLEGLGQGFGRPRGPEIRKIWLPS